MRIDEDEKYVQTQTFRTLYIHTQTSTGGLWGRRQCKERYSLRVYSTLPLLSLCRIERLCAFAGRHMLKTSTIVTMQDREQYKSWKGHRFLGKQEISCIKKCNRGTKASLASLALSTPRLFYLKLSTRYNSTLPIELHGHKPSI